MRPVSSTQDSLKYPLNEALGRESHVRILRVLVDLVEPIGVSTIAEKSGLTQQGTSKALEKLVQTGFVVEIGADRLRQYEFRHSGQTSSALIALFDTERKEYQRLLRGLVACFESLEMKPQSGWMETVDSRSGRQAEIGFLAEARNVAAIKSELRRRLFPMESEFDITFSLEGYSKADLAFIKEAKVKLIYGRHPWADDVRTGILGTQEDMDERARMWAKELATMVRNDPTLVTEARRWAEDRIEEGAGMATSDLQEWVFILSNYGKRQLMEFLVSESPRSHRLRQSSPLLAVLNDKQRHKLESAHSASNDDD